MAENITAMEKASSRQTNKARKTDSRVEYGRLFRNRKARWMGSGVIPPSHRAAKHATVRR